MKTEKEIQTEKSKRMIRYIGSIIGITSSMLAYVCYGWQLSLIIFLALIGNNIEQNNKRKANEE